MCRTLVGNFLEENGYKRGLKKEVLLQIICPSFIKMVLPASTLPTPPPPTHPRDLKFLSK